MSWSFGVAERTAHSGSVSCLPLLPTKQALCLVLEAEKGRKEVGKKDWINKWMEGEEEEEKEGYITGIGR